MTTENMKEEGPEEVNVKWSLFQTNAELVV